MKLRWAQPGSIGLNWAQVGLSWANKGSKWTQVGSKGFKWTQVGSNRPKKKSQILREDEDEFREKNLISWSELPPFKIFQSQQHETIFEDGQKYRLRDLKYILPQQGCFKP